MLDKKNPGLYNQAIMDFGATVCKPMLPLCAGCKLNKICKAYEAATVNKLPVKEKALSKKQRWFSYFIFKAGEKTFVRKRTEKDIWQNLFEFYLVESVSHQEWDKKMIADFLKQQLGIDSHEVKLITTAASQQLTHQHIKGYFIVIKLNTVPAKLKREDSLWLSANEIAHLPFPAFINQYLETKNVQPSLF